MPRRRTSTQEQQAAPALLSDPAWEQAKGTRRDLDHGQAAQESFFLQKQFRALWSGRMAASPVDLNRILHTLTKKKIPFVLTGAHALGGWTGRPRDTHDVDILVKAGRNHARAVNALKALYPGLEVRPFVGVTGFFIPGENESVIDVTYPHRADIEETLAHPVWVADKNTKLRYRIPSLEAALANKYGAMMTLSREPGKRLVDAADFTWMVKHSTDPGQQPIDLEKLRCLGELVWPDGGGKEILSLMDTVNQGGIVDLQALVKNQATRRPPGGG